MLADILLAFCVAFIAVAWGVYFTLRLVVSIDVRREARQRKYQGGIFTDELENEWLDIQDSQQKFLNWEADQGEPTLWPSEQRKPSAT